MQKINYFKILGLIEQINLDRDKLEFAYIKKQSEGINNEIIQQEINKAYRILKDDIPRIEHIFEIFNIPIDKNISQNDIERFFILNEELESVNNDEKIKKLIFIKNKLKLLLDEIQVLFDKNDYNSANKLLIEMRYLDKITKNN